MNEPDDPGADDALERAIRAQPSRADWRIRLTEAELFVVLVSSVRYALKRMTYVVGETAEIVKRHAHHLSPAERGIILRDLEQAIGEAESVGGRVGMECDHKVWVALAAHLRQLDAS